MLGGDTVSDGTVRDGTIVAIASPAGGAARGVVRLAGPRALELAGRVCRAPGLAGPGARRHEALLALEEWPAVPCSVWVFVAPRSYTGEDACELHLPGAPPLLAATVRALVALGARPAAPGEFTRRAFLNGRLDLARAEAVLALTNAEAEGEARAAARALQGGLARAIDGAKGLVLDALAHVEATIDFPEEDLPELAPAEAIAARVERARADLESLAGRSLATRVARAEPVVVLAGEANAGKSTLLNALARRDAALVSPHAGTTRDAVSAIVELAAGLRVRFVDTAGDKEAASAIEREALERSKELRESADLVLHVVDLSESRGAPRASSGPPELLVGTKADLAPGEADVDVRVSAVTGEGLPELARAIARRLERAELSPDLVQTERQARLVERARERLAAASALLRSSEPAKLELAAVDLRSVLGALGELTGAVATDDLLDRIFGEFCIGK